jgi:tRNA-splicing ligase RtcB
MGKIKITAKELRNIGFPEDPIIPITMDIIRKNLKHEPLENIIKLLKLVLEQPTEFLKHEYLYKIAERLAPISEPKEIELKEAVNFSIYGESQIETSAIKQMEVAVRLPISIAGALMPDAHQGYGLPIGGVLATRNAVIPYGVGVDIGCRMSLSILDIQPEYFEKSKDKFKRELIEQTIFGAGNGFKGNEKSNHAVLESDVFSMNKFMEHLKDKASSQLGTSGGGNHFVEFGILDLKQEDELIKIPKGKYLALLTHSGSRGLGATIAAYYTKLARELCVLPREASHLAYLDLNSEAGIEYWLAMNLAGDYASACHEVIHKKIAKALGAEILTKVENHHNFAWKEFYNGEQVIVHRKGATPAGKDVLGIIPGSMTAPGFLVKGRGEMASINSASHGAGRQMSRTKASSSITQHEMKKMLKNFGVELIGGGTDEAPIAYKNIHEVMNAQQSLVDIVAQFTPKMVRMADDGSKED